ncbi:MAG: hypothetical protein KDC54_05435, partial [Lewinella sp.]|nr:hypothetical protein [Lewinella sp.]
MRVVHLVYLLLFAGLVFVACQKESVAITDEPVSEEPLYTVPEIPAEIAEMMTAEDRARFEAGPGEKYLAMTEDNARFHPGIYHGRWHPVLLRLGYDLQFVPIGGDCQGDFEICFDQNGVPNPICFTPQGEFQPVGATGQTVADGYWKAHVPLHAVYWPVFCAPDYAGYGQGYYQVGGQGNTLHLMAENTPF